MSEEGKKDASSLKKRLEPVWWLMGLAVVIGTVGYTLSEKVGEFETKAVSAELHRATRAVLEQHNAADESKREALVQRIDQAEEEATNGKIRDIRIEAQQRNVDDRLQILIELARTGGTAGDRRAREHRIDLLEHDIDVRERAIKRSLGGPTRASGGEDEAPWPGPMEGLDGL